MDLDKRLWIADLARKYIFCKDDKGKFDLKRLISLKIKGCSIVFSKELMICKDCDIYRVCCERYG